MITMGWWSFIDEPAAGDPPAGAEPIEWLLLSRLPVDTAEQASELLQC
ncbi:hypothetical protein [Nitrococcus mobilis]|nr:hypothetical protein [Nitrococcus mobilis]